MADEAKLYARLADAFGDAARANERIAQAFAQLATGRGGDAHPDPEPEAAPRSPKPAAARLVSPTVSEFCLTPSALRVVAALRDADGQPLDRASIAIRAGIAYTSSTLDKAMAELRAESFVHTGLAVQAPELPQGHALFEYWLEKVGADAAPGKVLRAMRKALRDGHYQRSREQIATDAGIAYESSTLDKALALLRRHELLQTSGRLNELHADIRNALEPTIAVHDTTTGQTRRVKAR
jgi:hypothetical protein